MVHKLKTIPLYFNEIRNGNKSFEIRINDRNFKRGDEILFEEWVPDNYDWIIDKSDFSETGKYTGRVLHRIISYILPGGQLGIEKDYVIMSLEKI